MFDIQLRSLKDGIFEPCCQYVPRSITPLHITVSAFVAGLFSCYSARHNYIALALAFWSLNRVLDCLDGALARHRKVASDLGGFLDLLGDFIVYSLLPIAIGAGQPEDCDKWAAIAVLEATFHINNFVLFYIAAIAEKSAAGGRKSEELTSLMMKPALIEGMESALFFTAMLACPKYIGSLASCMAGAVMIGTAQRVKWAIPVLGGGFRDTQSYDATHPVRFLLAERIMEKGSIDNGEIHGYDDVGSDRGETEAQPNDLTLRPNIAVWRITISLVLLFLNYFLAQFDKFVLSYFQDEVVTSLDLSQSEYGLLSGYATGIVYALLALPTAYIADYTQARVWVLMVAALWWSLCVIFQGLSNNFWQILLARIGMGIGQAPVEAISVSLISDLMGKEYVFFGESVLYVGVYVGEAVSAQIAVAFARTNTTWSTALIAIGIVGIVVALFVRLCVREPRRQTSLVNSAIVNHIGKHSTSFSAKQKFAQARSDIAATFHYILRMRSFWLLTISAAFRQLAGNVFGYYMPTYLSTLYPSHPNLLSRYGIIVGVVGSVAVLSGGLLTSAFWSRTKLLPLYLTGVGGMISSVFVLLMIFSRSAAGGSENKGVPILYGSMTVAYLTAELWLGALNSLVALLLPPRYKTFGLSIWAATQVLVYSAGPEIIGLALRDVDSSSQEYLDGTKIALAVMISVGYWLAGVGFLIAPILVRRDLNDDFTGTKMGLRRKAGFGLFAFVVGGLVIGLFAASLVYRA